MGTESAMHDCYIGKKRFQLESEAKRRRYEQSSSNASVIAWGVDALKPYIQGGPVFDLACGNGRHTLDLVFGDQMICAGDISLPMLQAARKHFNHSKQIKALRLDAEHLPYGDDTFDATFSSRFFHHLPKPVRAKILGEIFRVSRNAVLVTVKKRGSIEHFRTMVKYLLKGKPFQYQRHFTTIGEFDRIARSHGWRVRASYSQIPCLSANCAILFEPVHKAL